MNGFLRMLVRTGVITTRAALSALATQRQLQTPIGQLAVQHGVLTQAHVLEILERQLSLRDGYTPFGQLAVELGLLASGDVAKLLEEQRLCRPALTSILAQQTGLSLDWLESAAKHYFGAREGARLEDRIAICERPAMEPGRRCTDVVVEVTELHAD